MPFTPNYTTRFTNDETYNFKKHYDDQTIYVVYAIPNFSIKVGSRKPSFVCFLKKRGEQFGDPLPASIGDGQSIIFRVYDNSGGIIINSPMSQTDNYLGEWIYNFSPLDFSEKGKYTGEIILLEGGEEPSESVLGKFYLNAN